MSDIAALASATSVFGWMAAGVYQVSMCYREKASGFSYLSLMFSIVSDTMNFLGCILTDRLAFQRVEAAIFLVFDTLFLIQTVYYRRKHNQQEDERCESFSNYSVQVIDGCETSQVSPSPVLSNSSKKSLPATPAALLGLTSAMAMARGAEGASIFLAVGDGPVESQFTRALFSLDQEQLAAICAWLAYIFNMSSIVPQYLHNRRDKSTQGVSMWLYVMALLGDSGYFVSIVASSLTIADIPTRISFIWSEMPFLVGTALSNMMVIALLCQYYEYRGRGQRLTSVGHVNYHGVLNG